MVRTVAPRRAARRPVPPSRCRPRAGGSRVPPRPGRAAGRSCGAALPGTWASATGRRRLREDGRGVGHGLVEEQREQVVGQVVVAADVAPRARDGLQVIRRLAADGQLAQPLQPGRHQLGGVRGEDGEQPGQVGAVPVACHVRLAEPDQAGGADAAEEIPGTVQHHDRVAGPPAPTSRPSGSLTRSGRLVAAAANMAAGHGRADGRARRHGDVGPPVRVKRVRRPACLCWSLNSLLWSMSRPRRYPQPAHIELHALPADPGARQRPSTTGAGRRRRFSAGPGLPGRARWR